MNGIDDLAAFVSCVQPADIAAPVRDKLRLHVADALGAWIAGMTTAEGRALIGFRDDLRHFAGGQGGLFDDVALHCALTRLSEVDDIHLASMITAGSIVIPATVCIATALPNTGASDLSAAMLGGYEAMIRLGLAIKGPDVLYRGICRRISRRHSAPPPSRRGCCGWTRGRPRTRWHWR
jgi:2-methylcitrate dehydratase PrpD